MTTKACAGSIKDAISTASIYCVLELAAAGQSLSSSADGNHVCMSIAPISRHEFGSLLGKEFQSLRKCAVALSGGVDSIALLSLLKEQIDQTPVQLYTFTVDHKLRPKSTAEAQYVHKQVEAMGLHHEILHIDKLPHTGVEEQARIARYSALTSKCLEYDIKALYLAHHADDQVETILMRLIQGSRWQGLVGMRAVANNPLSRTVYRAHKVMLHRPLLTMQKSRLIATCLSRNIHWHEDETNLQVGLTLRNAVRYILRQTEDLPKVLRPAMLLKASNDFLIAEDEHRRSKSNIFRSSAAVLHEDCGAITWNIRALCRSAVSDDVKISFVLDLANVITPSSSVDREVAKGVLRSLLKHNKDSAEVQFPGCGLLWHVRAEQCHIARQPFVRNEDHARIIERLSPATAQNRRILFDGRFFISVINNDTAFIIRNLRKGDVARLKATANETGRTESLKRCLGQIKGPARFTLPVIVEQNSSRILSLPSLDLTFDKSVQCKCTLVGKHLWRALQEG